jgi:hypothetical protein
VIAQQPANRQVSEGDLILTTNLVKKMRLFSLSEAAFCVLRCAMPAALGGHSFPPRLKKHADAEPWTWHTSPNPDLSEPLKAQKNGIDTLPLPSDDLAQPKSSFRRANLVPSQGRRGRCLII